MYEWYWRQVVTVGELLLRWVPGCWELSLMVVVYRKGEPSTVDEFARSVAEPNVVYWTGHGRTTTALVIEGGALPANGCLRSAA
ncbi:hypothetical protein SAMN05216276_107815 [Streptosporangium subroseum]|uniref:Uncharacterized protein n=1 Tax=Streptosporangium subroseum TaxID=106412 RepID=A0A239P1N9_9ACTN|nr:hypothetical protein SAMN05216276_107815 [Streptosporangium subroseum]